MDLAVDLYVAVSLLFTVLAIVLAFVFVRLRGGEEERPAEPSRQPGAAGPAREGEGAAGGAAPAAEPRDEGGRVPVEEVGAGEPGKEAAGEQREEAAEPGPATEPGPAATESITPRQPPAEPREPEQREDAESEIPPVGASPGSGLEQTGQAEGGSSHAAPPSKAEEEDLDAENEKLVVRELEDEDAADETFSFKYSPGKLRGNQYKSMMTKEELEEEQRTEDYTKLSLASS